MGLAHAKRHSVGAEHGPDAECADDRSEVLGDQIIEWHVLPRHAFGDCESECHSRVDVTAGHLADCVDERHDDETERKGDTELIGRSSPAIPSKCFDMIQR
jgi:hypothetical protein